MPLLLSLHLLSAVLWVGGMFFTHMILRPAAEQTLAQEPRIRLFFAVLSRFFPWVWSFIGVQVATGYAMIHEMGGFHFIALHIQLMQVTAWLMIAIFTHIYFLPFRRMRRMIKAELIPEAGLNLLAIRPLIGLNLILGLLTSLIAAAGRYLF